MMEIRHRQQTHQGDSEPLVFLLVIVGGLHLLFNAFPYVETMGNFFPFSGMQMTLRTYVWFISKNIGECLLYYIIWRLSGNEVLKYFFILQAVIFADFLLSYNSPIFIIGAVKYGVIHLTIMFKIGLLLIVWKKH